MTAPKPILAAAVALAAAAVAGALESGSGNASTAGIEKIDHVIILMQENRSFDHYFGTYPGADGIPMDADGKPTVCIPDPNTGGCQKPYHNPVVQNAGGPHDHVDAVADINGGKMDGFVKRAEAHGPCVNKDPCTTDVMGYHDPREIPNYWAYADHFVLQDRMFEPVSAWTLPSHLYLVSSWSAKCAVADDPASCKSSFAPVNPDFGNPPNYAWTDITYLLQKRRVSWGYYIVAGTEADCPTGDEKCPKRMQTAATPGHYNPLPWFTTVRQNNQLGNIQSYANFLSAAAAGTLPAVSWVVPSERVSEHPPSTVSNGQAFVTRLINAVMQGPNWSSSAIFLSWDDWGGFYDHVPPTKIDGMGYGLRVPGLMISPYARRGYIDHQTLSFDAYLKFIEDRFLGGQRLDPRTDGRPDPRPTVRENASKLGDLANEFDFQAPPQPPLILPLRP